MKTYKLNCSKIPTLIYSSPDLQRSDRISYDKPEAASYNLYASSSQEKIE